MPESTGQRGESILVLVMALAAAGAGLAALNQSRVAAAALFIAAGLPWVLIRLPKVKGWLQQAWVPALTLSVSFAAAGFAVLEKPANSPAPPPTTAPTASPSPSPRPEPISFIQPNDKVPHCNDFSGVGITPQGKMLLIFDRGLAEPNEPYWFNKAAKTGSNGWSASNIQLGDGKGDEGKEVELSLVLVPEKLGLYISSIGADELWWSGQLPADPVDSITVVRNSDATPCK